MSVFFLGYFLAVLFALLYIQAIRYRRNMQLHARYMGLTALVFLIPGLGRAAGNYLAPLEIPLPTFYQWFFLPLLIGIGLMIKDWRQGKEYRPYLFSNVAWVSLLVIWPLAPHIPAFRSYAESLASGL